MTTEDEDLVNKVWYEVREEVYCLGEKRRLAYGIAAYASADEEGWATVIESVGDICDDRSEVARLVRLCNLQQLDPSQLHDVVEDFLCG